MEVTYKFPFPDLHTKLFIKLPFAFDGKNKYDRMQISINQQPGDLAEVDSYRLLEASLPFRMPKYYYADISNETTNFILITECIPFGDKNREHFAPYEVQPAYRKFFDAKQFKDPLEYYLEMTRRNAEMAGWYKAGKLGDHAAIAQFFPDQSKFPPPASLSKAEFTSKLKMGEAFIGEMATHLYPKKFVTAQRLLTWKKMLSTYNAYRSDFGTLQNANADAFALHHINMNVDNCWWWRDDEKNLRLGALDWGGLAIASVTRQLWWSYYGAEYDMLVSHSLDLLRLFADCYEEHGGPRLDIEVVKRDFFIAAIDQGLGLLGAVPAIYKVVKKQEWPSVKDRYDNRIMDSYLTKMYVCGFLLFFQLCFCKLDLEQVLETGVQTLRGLGAPKREVFKVTWDTGGAD